MLSLAPSATLRHRAPGFSLAELMISLAMFGLVALALQSAVLLASKAIPDGKGVNVSLLAASRVADQLTGELAYALSVTELAATAITFTVADRDNDGADESIRYAWSGVAGQALTRTYNGQSTDVLGDVQEFALSYDKHSVINTATYTESAESLLYSFNAGLISSAFAIQEPDEWCGQYFLPTLPNNAAYWRVTRVRYQAREHGPGNGVTRVQLRKATASGLPTTVVLGQTKLWEFTLNSSFAWVDSSLTGNVRLDSTEGACVVFRWAADADSCDVLSKTLSLALGSGAKFVSTSNGGSTWSANSLRAMPLYVYGVSGAKDADTYSYFLDDARIVMRCGTDAAARIHVVAPLLSQPQVPGP